MAGADPCRDRAGPCIHAEDLAGVIRTVPELADAQGPIAERLPSQQRTDLAQFVAESIRPIVPSQLVPHRYPAPIALLAGCTPTVTPAVTRPVAGSNRDTLAQWRSVNGALPARYPPH